MSKILRRSLVVAVCVFMFSSFVSGAMATPTRRFQSLAVSGVVLADTLNSVIKNVTWSTADSWTAEWAPILVGQNGSALDAAITQDVNRGDYADALYVARIADVNNYSSPIVSSQTQMALEQMPMCGSLPATFNDARSYGDSNPTCFLVYNRYILWGYQYAQQYGLTSKWNVTKAFADFAALYDEPPINSAFGEMLFCDPRLNWAYSWSSRYYDECAETLSVFLKFAEQGVPRALAYADKAWAGLQNHWTGQYYEYTTSSQVVECEMGNFAQVIAEYAQQKGGIQNISNWNRVIQDLNYKLLANGWSSPGWASPSVLIHAKGVNNELRLWETMGAITALQELYQYFTPTMQTSLQNMLTGSGTTPAWQGLMTSSLNVNDRFKGTSSDTSASNDATVCAAATLFLDGIVPVTGSLAVPFREENYNDFRTQFQYSQFQFDYGNHRIRIPVNKGELTFIYGFTPVSFNFPANGVYDVQFSSDWNQITSVNGQPVASAPSAPRNLKATVGNAQVALSWSAPSSDGGSAITNYTIYRGTASGAETLYSTMGNVSAYTDVMVANGQTYYYEVSASNAVGESSPSDEVSACAWVPTAELYLVHVGLTDNMFWGSVDLNTTSFSSWNILPGMTTLSATTAVSNGVLYIVHAGVNNDMFWGSVNLTDSSFSGWTMLPGKTNLTPSIAVSNGKLYIVHVGYTNNMFWGSVNLTDSTFSGWNTLPGMTSLSVAAAVSNDMLYIVHVGLTSNMFWGSVNLTDSTFSGWNTLPGMTRLTPSVATYDGNLYLAHVGFTSNMFWGSVNLTDSTFSGWNILPGSTNLSVGVALWGEFYVVHVGYTNDMFWGGVNPADSSFSGWTILPGKTILSVAATASNPTS